jgi:hypothetical protein
VFYANITRKLANRGMKSSADELVKEFGLVVGAIPVTGPSANPPRGSLPTSCPKCGAPLHGNEANWIDAKTAECAYCGTSIRPLEYSSSVNEHLADVARQERWLS